MNVNIKSYTQGLKELTNWYKSDSKYFYLVGCTGSGKTTILNEFYKNINHKYYDCHHKNTINQLKSIFPELNEKLLEVKIEELNIKFELLRD